MQVTIMGTGALACLFGAGLRTAAEVTLVGTWPEGLAALRVEGVRVEGGPTVRVGVAGLGEPAAAARLVLVLVKAWQTAQVAPFLDRYLAPNGIALTLQNGLGNLEQLGPRARLGVTTAGATLLGPGHVRPGGDGETHLAAPAWVAALFQQAGFDADSVPAAQVDALLWGKLAVNCAINPLTALLRVPNGELLRRPDALRVMDAAAAECAAVAAARGIALPYADEAAQARLVAERTAHNRSSMFQDILRGAPTEVDAINGAVAQAGRSSGVPTPTNETLWRLVRALAHPPRSQP